MAAKPTLKAIAAAIASQAPLEHAAEQLTRKPRAAPLRDDAEVGELASPDKRDQILD